VRLIFLSCLFVIFRGRKIQFKNFIGFHDGVKLVRSVAGGHLEAIRTARQVGDVSPGGTISLTVSCCLRQPRIASGATRLGGCLLGHSWASELWHPAIYFSSQLTAANAVRLIMLSCLFVFFVVEKSTSRISSVSMTG
tara:strand:- start:84772 stop:85185 length:414 start_codon:yes stop_codon:yes gene_type:complete